MVKPVYVYSNHVTFPAICPNCLEGTDLTTYKQREEKHKRGSKTARIVDEIPICKACKRKLMNSERKKNASAFLIFAPIFWGLLYIIVGVPAISNPVWNTVLTAGSQGYSIWLLLLVFVLLFLAALPLLLLWYTIEPSKQVSWPVKLEGTHTLYFVNETYADLFKTANNAQVNIVR